MTEENNNQEQKEKASIYTRAVARTSIEGKMKGGFKKIESPDYHDIVANLSSDSPMTRDLRVTLVDILEKRKPQMFRERPLRTRFRRSMALRFFEDDNEDKKTEDGEKEEKKKKERTSISSTSHPTPVKDDEKQQQRIDVSFSSTSEATDKSCFTENDQKDQDDISINIREKCGQAAEKRLQRYTITKKSLAPRNTFCWKDSFKQNNSGDQNPVGKQLKMKRCSISRRDNSDEDLEPVFLDKKPKVTVASTPKQLQRLDCSRDDVVAEKSRSNAEQTPPKCSVSNKQKSETQVEVTPEMVEKCLPSDFHEVQAFISRKDDDDDNDDDSEEIRRISGNRISKVIITENIILQKANDNVGENVPPRDDSCSESSFISLDIDDLMHNSGYYFPPRNNSVGSFLDPPKIHSTVYKKPRKTGENSSLKCCTPDPSMIYQSDNENFKNTNQSAEKVKKTTSNTNSNVEKSREPCSTVRKRTRRRKSSGKTPENPASSIADGMMETRSRKKLYEQPQRKPERSNGAVYDTPPEVSNESAVLRLTRSCRQPKVHLTTLVVPLPPSSPSKEQRSKLKNGSSEVQNTSRRGRKINNFIGRVGDAASKKLNDKPESFDFKVPKVPPRRGPKRQPRDNTVAAMSPVRRRNGNKANINYNENILWHTHNEYECISRKVQKDTRPSIRRRKQAEKVHKPTPRSPSAGPTTSSNSIISSRRESQEGTSNVYMQPSKCLQENSYYANGAEPSMINNVSKQIDLSSSSMLSGLLTINPGGAKTFQQSDSELGFRVLDGEAKVGIKYLQSSILKPFEPFLVPKDSSYYIINRSKEKKLVLSFSQKL